MQLDEFFVQQNFLKLKKCKLDEFFTQHNKVVKCTKLQKNKHFYTTKYLRYLFANFLKQYTYKIVLNF